MTRWRRARSASGGAQRGASREERPIEGAPPGRAVARLARDRRRPRRIPRAAVAGELRRSLAVGRDDLMAVARKASVPFGRDPEASSGALGEVPLGAVNHPRQPRAIYRLARRRSRRSLLVTRRRRSLAQHDLQIEGDRLPRSLPRSLPRRRVNQLESPGSPGSHGNQGSPGSPRSPAASLPRRRSLASALASIGSASRISALTSARRSSPAGRPGESFRWTSDEPRSSGSGGSAATSRRSPAARSTSRRRRSPRGRRGSSSVGSACSIRSATQSSPRRSTSSARTGSWSGT